jgi:hypothetical protein
MYRYQQSLVHSPSPEFGRMFLLSHLSTVQYLSISRRYVKQTPPIQALLTEYLESTILTTNTE